MKKYLIVFIAAAALLFGAGQAKAEGFIAEPQVTWDPQSRCFPAGSDAVYSVTASGQELSFSWSMEYNGKTYDVVEQKAALMAAGLSAYCSDIRVESENNTSQLTLTNVKQGLDCIYGKYTKVACTISNSRGGAFSNNAYVLVGPANIPYPPEIYIKPVAAFYPEDTGKVACTVFEQPGVTYHYQWYRIEQAKLEYAMAVDYADDSPILIADFEQQFTDYICMVTAEKDGVSADSYSSPINVYKRSGSINTAYDQLVITQKPDYTRFDLGDKVDLSGMHVDYYENGKKESDIPLDKIETDITVFDYAGPVRITIRYKNEEDFLDVWVDPDANGNWILEEDPNTPVSLYPILQDAKTQYTAGEKLDTSGLKIRVYTAGGFYDTDDMSLFNFACDDLNAPGYHTVYITLRNGSAQGSYLVSVTQAPTQPAPSTEEATQPDKPSEEATQENKTTAPETQPESAQPGTEKASEAESAATKAPEQTTAAETQPAAPQGGSGGNTVLIVLVVVLASVCGLLGGILLGRRKK